MGLFNLISTAFQSLGKNKFRSFLTMLGIIIGVGAVIVMQAIGKGAEASINSTIASLGTNLIMVSPAATGDQAVRTESSAMQSLKIEDAEAIKKYCSSVKYVSPLVRSSGQLKYGSKNWRTSIFGVSSDYLIIREMTVSQGVVFSQNDEKKSEKVCLIGKTVKDNLFPAEEDPLGKVIRVGQIPFKIIGILKSKGQSGFGQDQDDIILAPYTSVINRISGNDYIQQIYISATDNSVDVAVDEITNIMKIRHKIAENSEDDFSINTQAEIAEKAKSITGILTLLLASIAAISLLVGGIGIMNIMLVSVTERTREIGIRLAIGATAFDILSQLLIESVVLSVTAGVFGVLAGAGVSSLISALIGWETVITPEVEIYSFIICSIIGVFFGWYPARKAANLNPIDALRYE